MKKILLTGSNGFLGRAILSKLIVSQVTVIPSVRNYQSKKLLQDFDCEKVLVSPLAFDTDWSEALADVDVVIHCAAKTDSDGDTSANSVAEFYDVNVNATLALARQAASLGVRRFVFISTVKVHGENTLLGKPFTRHDILAPQNAYADSKAEAEIGLVRLARSSGMEVVIIRPPMIYGPSVKGNFQKLLNSIERDLILPFAEINENQRSMVALDNLVDLILTCVRHPKAANQTFLVSDGEDLSTAELLRRIAKAMNRSARLLSVPVPILAIGAKLLGKGAVAQRILGSLQVDISETCELLQWKPPTSVNDGLCKAVRKEV